MSRRLVARLSLLVVALTLVSPAAARAEKRSLSYELDVNDKPVGSRSADLNYLPGEQGEVVTLEAFTDFTLGSGRAAHHYKQRLGGRFGGARSFSSSVSDNKKVHEVQGQVDSQGNWDITVVEGRGARHVNVEGSRIDLNSAELLDPDRALKTLTQVKKLRVLLTETGDIAEGAVENLGPGQIIAGGQSLQVHRFRWSPPDAQMLLCYTDDGLLASYETTFLGRKLAARLVSAPPARTYTETFDPPLTGQTVNEEGVR